MDVVYMHKTVAQFDTPMVKAMPCHLLHSPWNQTRYGSAEADKGIVSGYKRGCMMTQPLWCWRTGSAAAPLHTVWTASPW